MRWLLHAMLVICWEDGSGGTRTPSLMTFPSTERWYREPSASLSMKVSFTTRSTHISPPDTSLQWNFSAAKSGNLEEASATWLAAGALGMELFSVCSEEFASAFSSGIEPNLTSRTCSSPVLRSLSLLELLFLLLLTWLVGLHSRAVARGNRWGKVLKMERVWQHHSSRGSDFLLTRKYCLQNKYTWLKSYSRIDINN